MELAVDLMIELSNVGREVTDQGWREIGPIHIAAWSDASDLLGTAAFETEGAKIRLEIDWRPAVSVLKHNHNVTKSIYVDGDIPKYSHHGKKYKIKPINIKCRAHIVSDGEAMFVGNLAQSLLDSFLYDMFLIMNISAPGSFGGRVRTRQLGQPNASVSEFSLYGGVYEVASLNLMEGRWPQCKFLPVSDVHQWFLSIRSGYAQLPKNRMEKVVFGLLHIAVKTVSPEAIIWIFYCLETIFDTKVGENFRTLVERIGLLLKPTPSELKRARQQLRNMYDIRSAFVHGGLDATHPMHNETLDRGIEKKFGDLMDASDLGISILLCSVQEVISRGWKEPIFEEVLRGGLESKGG